MDLLTPANDASTNNSTITFEYYASVQGLTGCGVLVNGNAFPDPHAQTNTINDVQVQGIQPGAYRWNVTCTGAVAETSATRSFTVDTQAPTLAVVSPAAGVQKSIALDIIPNDETSQLLWCNASWTTSQGTQQLESFQAAGNVHYAKNYTGAPGNGTLTVVCADAAGNAVTQQRTFLLVPDFSLLLALDKTQYGLGEPVRLTIDTVSGANVSVDTCPDQQGFVQCTSALLTSSTFPQTITLPYTNVTGSFIIEGIAAFAGQTKLNQTRFSVTNSMTVSVQPSRTPKLNTTINLTAAVGGGIGPYRINWRLHNGTVINDASIVGVYFNVPGTYNETVTAYDRQNNMRATNITITVDPVYTVAFSVVDNKTGAPITGADVDLDGQKVKTIQGYAYFDLEPGVYRLFASAAGYQYVMEEYLINSSQTIPLRMAASVEGVPQVTLHSPGQNSTVSSPVSVRYSVSYRQQVTCTLYFGTGSGWFQPNGSMIVTDGGTKEFVRELPEGEHQARIECADSAAASRTGASPTVQFIVAQPGSAQKTAQAGDAAAASTAPSDDEVRLQSTMEALESILQAMDGYGPKEKEVIAATGFDKNVRATKRAVQQAVRDINDLQFRNELDDTAKQAERKRIIAAADAQLANTPLGLTVTDTKAYVRYIEEEDIDAVAEALAGLGGMTSDQELLAKRVLPDQQKFTVSTRVSQVDYLYADKSTKSVTVIMRSLTYAPNLDPDYKVYEIIPKEVAKSARELVMLTKADVLKDDPVLRYGTGSEIVYVIPKRVDTTRVEDIKTVLAKPYAESGGAMAGLTGFAIFDSGLLGGDLFGVSAPLVILIVIIVLAYLAYALKLGQNVRFFLYRFGRKEKVHYVRVLINDALANIDANDYGKADMLYKEVRLTYDTLSVPERNDLYDDIVGLVKRMDEYYFNMVMLELDTHLKANDVDAAILSYEKLTGTYSRLDVERQQQLVATVTAMARRIGLEAKA